jgi:subfamily B ATP-binding cassette protein HlyB/CyaB
MNGKHNGLASLGVICAYSGVSFDAEQIIHNFYLKDKTITYVDLMKIAQTLGFKTRLVKPRLSSIHKLPLPCVCGDKSGGFFVIAKADKETVLILKEGENAPAAVSKADFANIFNKKAVLFKHKFLAESSFKFGITWFFNETLKYKNLFTEVLIASLTLQIFGLFTPMIMQVVIDKVLVHNSLTTLDVMGVGLGLIIIFELLMGVARNYVFTDMTSKIDVILGDKLFKHLIRLPLNYFENRRCGDTVSRIKELENVRRFLTGTPLTAILDVMFIAVYIVVMLFYSKSLTAIVLLSLPIFAIISATSTPVFKRQLDEKFAAGAESNSYMVETVNGINTVKSLALEPKMEDRWGGLLARYTHTSYKTAVLSGNINAAAGFFQKLFDIIILWYGARLVMDRSLTVGQLIAFRMLSSRVSTPVLRIVQLWTEFQQTKVSIERIGDIFKVKPEIGLDESKTRLPEIKGFISFENVIFRYRPNAPEVIKNLSFKIPAGAVIGIVGRSGSGKSTLAKLIQRLYIPESGKIQIDGVDISLADTAWLRRQIGVVLQENFLFNLTIKENICMNKPNAAIEEVVKVCQMAGAHEFIAEMPAAYDTPLGENGTGLSGGQKQRIAIARALIDDPKILMFDEATSALDYESERIINNNLKEIARGRTVLIIAHRLSTIKNADAVIVMDKGQLAEYGPIDKLLEHKGLYYHLHNQQ